MSTNAINAGTLSKMFLSGAKNLEANKEWINELNVFPVPDGDTGTNMTMTIMSAVKEVVSLGESEDMMAICKAISSGSLRGARGNSGVILSQLLRGFCKGVREHADIDVPVFADAFDRAVETAYKAVMKPKEGTILTVAKGAATKSRELADQGETDLDVYFKTVIEYADSVLASTPDMLPVLKQAGVVDSGGQGLMQVLKGAYDAYLGKEIDYEALAKEVSAPKEGERREQVNPEARANAEIKFGYCTEFIILLNKHFGSKTEKDFKAYLESIGDSIVCVPDEEVVKVHVHTNDPGLAIQRGLLYGQLSKIKIDNMRLEHQETLEKQENSQESAKQETAPVQDPGPKKEVGFIAVSVGDGIEEIFKSLGADYVISGGQTMNPSTDDVLQAISQVNADTIYIFPNNKNIILAANQAAGMTKDKNIIVIPTKTIPQGITAIINYMPDLDAEANKANMTEEISHVKSAEVTYAVRDTMIDGMEIHESDMMGIGDAGIVAVGPDRDETALKTLQKIAESDTEMISVYYGADITEEEAQTFQEKVQAAFPGCDVELQSGGQPIYYYILSAE